MPTDASGTPTTNYNIPKYNTAGDAPSGKGNGAQMDFIDNLLKTGFVNKPATLNTNDVPIWNGTTWVHPSGTASSSTFLRGDGTWASPTSTKFGCRLTHSVDQNIANTDTLTTLSFDTELYDNGGCHDTVTNNSRITIPVGAGGLWHFHFGFSWPGTPSTIRAVFFKNGTDYNREEQWVGGGTVEGGMDALIQVSAGDYIQVQIAQTSGSNPYPVKHQGATGTLESPVFAGALVA